MPNALKDMKYIEEHPEARASDLKTAFMDHRIKAIVTAIGGIDTYKKIPYLMDDPKFIEAVKNNPKIFTGFSDTTNNHLMLNKIGLSTFYGPCLLVDIAELDNEMLPYTKEQFEKFFTGGKSYEMKSSPVWYSDRKSYGPEEIGKTRESHKETHGFETLNGQGTATGKLYGGCVESIYESFMGTRFADQASVYEKYYEEYKEVYKKVFSDLEKPILYNVNFGHSVPRHLLPYDAEATIDYDNKRIFINTEILK